MSVWRINRHRDADAGIDALDAFAQTLTPCYKWITYARMDGGECTCLDGMAVHAAGGSTLISGQCKSRQRCSGLHLYANVKPFIGRCCGPRREADASSQSPSLLPPSSRHRAKRRRRSRLNPAYSSDDICRRH